MSNDAGRTHSDGDTDTVHKRRAVEHAPKPTAAEGGINAALQALARDATQASSALTRTDSATRARVVTHLQQSGGNARVQRVLQRSADARGGSTGEDLSARIQAASGGGSALETNVQRRLEQGLGADLSSVRIHADTEADQLSRAVDARAFTTGSDIFFRSGEYDPQSSEGLQTLAHEATHVVQQSAGPVAGTPARGGVSISNPSDSFETAASHTAQSVVSSGPAVQRQEVPDDEEQPKKNPEEDEAAVAG